MSSHFFESVRLKNIEITIFILVTRLIPLCDVYCYLFLNELGFYVLSAFSEMNLTFLFEEVPFDPLESGEEIRYVFGLRQRGGSVSGFRSVIKGMPHG